MRAVWKYALKPDDHIELSMPEGAWPLTVMMQGKTPCLWALVNPHAPLCKRLFRMAGTGHPIRESESVLMEGYVGSFLMEDGALVFHVFEV